MEISFYKIKNEMLIKTICQIVEKAYYNNFRININVQNELLENEINKSLWTYSQKTFIPHGSSCDPLPEQHPVYISQLHENLNKANLKIFINNIEICRSDYKKIIYIFTDSENNEFKSKELYDEYLKLNYEVQYYIQQDKVWKVI